MASEIDKASEQMEKTVSATEEHFASIRTGRANPAFLNDITVEYYGTETPLKSLATISVAETRTLAVTPFDASQAPAVEKAIRDSDLGVNPNRDGNVIRVTLPELTEERRKDYVKLVRAKAEEGKIAVRNIRRKTKEAVEASVKDGQIGEDDGKRLQKELEAITKKTTDKIDSLLAGKEKEILSV